MYRDTVVLLTLNWLSYTVYAAETIDVRSYSCDQHTVLDNVRIFYLEWLGSNLPDPCKYGIGKDNYDDEICVHPEVFDVSNTDAEIQYHEYLYTTTLAEKKFDYNTRPYGDWCTSASKLIISFQSTGSSDHVKLKVFLKEGEDYSDSSTSDAGMTTVVVIVAIIGVVITSCVIVICIAVRRSQAGNMASRTQCAYHTTSPGGVTIQTGSNPQTPYQPQAVAQGQAGYTFHPPQAAFPVGTNQPTGYPPQQAGYVPPPGGYYGQGTNQATPYPTGQIPPSVQGEHRPSPQPSPRAMHELIPSAPPDPSASQVSRYDPPPYPGC